jgi:hypothetical protein
MIVHVSSGLGGDCCCSSNLNFFGWRLSFDAKSREKQWIPGGVEIPGSGYEPMLRPSRSKARRCKGVGNVSRSKSTSGADSHRTEFLQSVAKSFRRH